MDTYETMTNSVLAYLKEHGYCSSLIRANERCFEKLGKYLSENGIIYSPETAFDWYSLENSLSFSDRSHGKVALIRLQDVAETGYIRPEHETKPCLSPNILNNELRKAMEDYLLFKGQSVSETQIKRYHHICTVFLAFVQSHGVQKPDDIKASLIYDFYRDVKYTESKRKTEFNCCIAGMMNYFFENGSVSYSCSLILHYLTHGKQQGCFWNDISPETHMRINAIMDSAPTVQTDILRSYKEKLVNLHRENGYSKGVITVNNRILDLLILFLEMNNYCYNPEIAEIWFEDLRTFWGKQVDCFRRALLMAAEYHRTSCFSLEKMYRQTPSRFQQLPSWCKETAQQYLEQKMSEGWERSTLDMIRSSITRFCMFLDKEGIRSFSDMDASHIKKFNETDRHKTPQGKNAYNVRIRKFLIYLGEHRFLDNPMLFASLPCTSAPKETIVVVLTEEEMDELNEQLNEDDPRLSLRKKAMLLLGLKMGLRSSDVVNLTIDSINWMSASIRFVQKKTSVEVNLPMPAEVGNALFRYITEERGMKDNPNIFLSEKAPRRSVGRMACRKALKSALPERNVEGSGFHVLRKTYATTLLKRGVGANMVAEALGQRGTTSVHRYLSLDTERMRMCPLSLSECSLGGWKNEE